MKPAEFIELLELSNDKLAQYKTAAAADASKADSEGNFKKGDKRFKGINTATKKQFANDAKSSVSENILAELDTFAPRTVYFKMADGNYIKADYRGSGGFTGNKAYDNVTFTSMSWVNPNTAKSLGLDKFLAQGSESDVVSDIQYAQNIVGTSSPGEGPLGNRTIDVVDFVNGKKDTVPSALKTKVMQWVEKNTPPQQQGVAEDQNQQPPQGAETLQQKQVRAAITKGMAKWDQSDLATYKSQPTNLHYWDPSGWASGQLEGINSIDPDGTVVIELNDTTTAGLVKKLAALGGMPGVKTRQLKMAFNPAKMKNGVTPGEVSETVGLPYPGTYEETNDMFKSTGQRRIGTLTTEDEQIDGMAQGEIREIIKNAIHIKNQLDKGVSLDGWMYSYVTTSNDHLNSVAEQINNPNIDEEKVRLDPKCWTGKHKEGTKMKGGVRVNNCVPNESAIFKGIKG